MICSRRKSYINYGTASESTRAQNVPVELAPLGHEVTLVHVQTCPCQPQEVEEDHTRLSHKSNNVSPVKRSKSPLTVSSPKFEVSCFQL